ncbi:MAG: hypothetical protein PHY08_14050 [Candidatus Cloacimonetes bacterium]|nr:hypothetical protein [Candidatus Cloacimonadota bacterium]
MINEKLSAKALSEFQKQYPSVTSTDLQTFVLGWLAAEKAIQFSPSIAKKLLKFRDLLIESENDNSEQIYYILYSIASPEFDKTGNVWDEMERIAAITDK